jgi:hypothetical protein
MAQMQNVNYLKSSWTGLIYFHQFKVLIVPIKFIGHISQKKAKSHSTAQKQKPKAQI